jgi:mRNA interferase MazF
MTTFQAGDVILVSFPFADQEKRKKRPALVVADTGDRDVVVARITTHGHADGFAIAMNEWQDAGLLAAAFVRVNKLATLEKDWSR